MLTPKDFQRLFKDQEIPFIHIYDMGSGNLLLCDMVSLTPFYVVNNLFNTFKEVVFYPEIELILRCFNYKEVEEQQEDQHDLLAHYMDTIQTGAKDSLGSLLINRDDLRQSRDNAVKEMENDKKASEALKYLFR